MALLNVKFYNIEDDLAYSDGSIEDEIYQRVCDQDTTLMDDSRWPVFYHFSPLRQNILNWYPFRKNSSVLEIGAGCGALTGLFVDRAESVTACELTMRRAKINYERHCSANNLEIIVGDFCRMEFETQYDYVIINGVLEYSAAMVKKSNEDPYIYLLNKAKACLRKGGKLLLAIENRFGLKYFSGAPEDHLGEIFAGIDDYSKNSTIRTFTKGELEILFGMAELKVLKWYYPFPDYKFPTEIFTDDTIHSRIPTLDSEPFDLPRIKLFSEYQVYRGLMTDKISEYFSNSFLVELSQEDNNLLNPYSYIKISNNRCSKFCICTILNMMDGVAYKKPLYSSGVTHLRKMASQIWKLGSLHSVHSEWNGQALIYKLLKEETLLELLNKVLDDEKQVWRRLNFLKKSLYAASISMQLKNEAFEAVFGNSTCSQPLHWQENMNIDLLAENIFCNKDDWTIIDNEWTFDFLIPSEYVLWRCINQLSTMDIFEELLQPQAIRNFVGISEQTEVAFLNWERNFAERYVGIRDLSPLWKPVVSVKLDEIIDEKKDEGQFISQLFLFLEQDTNEPIVLKSKAVLIKDIWSVKFFSPELKRAVALRWDPLEGSACQITDVKVTSLIYEAKNAEKEEPEYTFATYDPQFSLYGDFSKLDIVEIEFRCKLLDWTLGYYKRETELISEKSSRQFLESINKQLEDAAQGTKLQLQQQQANLLIERQKKLLLVTELSAVQAQMLEKNTELKSIQNQISGTEAELKIIQESLSKSTVDLGNTQEKLLQTELALQKQIDVTITLSDKLNKRSVTEKTHRFSSAIKILLGKDI